MLRLVLRLDDAGMAANVGGAVLTKYLTFDVDLPEVEKAMRVSGYTHCQLVGCEVIEPASAKAEDGR